MDDRDAQPQATGDFVVQHKALSEVLDSLSVDVRWYVVVDSGKLLATFGCPNVVPIAPLDPEVPGRRIWPPPPPPPPRFPPRRRRAGEPEPPEAMEALADGIVEEVDERILDDLSAVGDEDQEDDSGSEAGDLAEAFVEMLEPPIPQHVAAPSVGDEALPAGSSDVPPLAVGSVVDVATAPPSSMAAARARGA